MLRAAAVCVCAVALVLVSARSDGGNSLDDKWRTGRWDRFRDEPGTWSPSRAFDQGLDPARDPCLKIKCSRHKVCVSEDYKTASCVSQRRVSFKDAARPQRSKCTPCPVVHPTPVCGTDGHSYSTKCKLEYQACITGKKIAVKCSGMCPCPAHPEQSPAYPDQSPAHPAQSPAHPAQSPAHPAQSPAHPDQSPAHPAQSPAHPAESPAEIKGCGPVALREVGARLRDWFRVLRDNGNHRRPEGQRPERSKLEAGPAPPCKDPLGWMFSRLDTNFDLQLDQSETRSLYLDRNEPCGHALLRSCGAHDHRISIREWCSCFQRVTGDPVPGGPVPGGPVPGGPVPGGPVPVVLESSGDLGSGDSLFPGDDEDEDKDSFVVNDRADADAERYEDEDDEDEEDEDEDEYLS